MGKGGLMDKAESNGQDNKRSKTGQFMIGSPGTEKRWKTPEELQKDIDAYFKETDNNPYLIHEFAGKDAESVRREVPRPYTIEGLCCVLDCDRQTILNYEKRKGYEPYFAIIIHARKKIHRSQMEAALAGVSNASITKMILTNNMKYTDKSQVDVGPTDELKEIAFKLVLPKKLEEKKEDESESNS